MGANITYPYDVPMLTENGRIGLWTLSGLREQIEDEAEKTPPPPPNQKSGGISFSIDTGKPPK